MPRFIPPGLGWIPDLPDPRDYTHQHEKVLRLLRRLKPAKRNKLPKRVDLRRDDHAEYFTPPENQGLLNSSSVCAVLGLVEYFERRAGHTFEGSMLFLYKMARTLRGTTGDCGVDLRTTLKALRRFGVVPYDLWYKASERFDDVPPDASLLGYGYARDYQDACYVRLDARDAKPSKGRRGLADFAESSEQTVPVPLPRGNLRHALGSQTLRNVKSFLAAGFPVAFGFPVPRSLTAESRIPYRPTFDSFRGGQAALAVGYDDQTDTSPPGAILIRNSWGETWGDAGWGWLPYAYVEQQLAKDFWTLLRKEWLDPNEFSLPSVP